MADHTRSTKATCAKHGGVEGEPLTLIVATRRNRSRSAQLQRDAPVTLPVLVVHTREILFPGRPVNPQLQWLVHVGRQIFCVVRADLHERLDVLLDLCGREPPHEV
jgi:hypothetical protein